MGKIIVGVDESPSSVDAIALASSLAGMTGATLMLVNVFPYDTHPSRAINRDFEDYLRHDSTEMLERIYGQTQGDEMLAWIAEREGSFSQIRARGTWLQSNTQGPNARWLSILPEVPG